MVEQIYVWIKSRRSPVTAHGDPVGPPGPQNVKDMRFLRLETSLYTIFCKRVHAFFKRTIEYLVSM